MEVVTRGGAGRGRRRLRAPLGSRPRRLGGRTGGVVWWWWRCRAQKWTAWGRDATGRKDSEQQHKGEYRRVVVICAHLFTCKLKL